ncbi:TRAP transporter small permease [Oceanibium sediminis]|uniref:TRAP transporter small permease n=1 Tax=Oceanibium sediminis TaxID=2026339 RepID=UPI000DD4E37F|nr:TRAP transporter small permease [Oceanibium sediminis]
MTAMPTARLLDRLERLVVRWLSVALGLGLILLVLVNVANAVGRYSGWYAMTGADEVLVYGMIWIVMLGAILAARERSHLSINLLQQALSVRGGQALQLLIDLVTLFSATFIAYHSLNFIERIAMIGQTSMALRIPMVVPHSAIFVGFAGIAFVTALLLLADLSRLFSRSARS